MVTADVSVFVKGLRGVDTHHVSGIAPRYFPPRRWGKMIRQADIARPGDAASVSWARHSERERKGRREGGRKKETQRERGMRRVERSYWRRLFSISM